MTLKEYIESGVLHAYALHALSQEESVAVEAMLEQFPELGEALREIELTLENLATADGVAPPPASKPAIWEALSRLPAAGVPQQGEAGDYKETAAPVARQTVDFTPPASRSFNWLAAAAVMALLLSVGGNIYLWQQRQHTLRNMAFLEHRLTELRAESGQLQQRLVTYNEQEQMLLQPGMQRVMLTSKDTASPSVAAVIIGPGSKKAFVTLRNMPPLPAGKQYQLWVLKGGKPSSMGVIPNRALAGGAEAMNLPVAGGEAYAISLEKEGGVVQPTMSAIQVLGTPS